MLLFHSICNQLLTTQRKRKHIEFAVVLAQIITNNWQCIRKENHRDTTLFGRHGRENIKNKIQKISFLFITLKKKKNILIYIDFLC